MTWPIWLAVVAGALAILVTVAALSVRGGRRAALIELARLVPLCLALLRDLIRDPAVPRRAKIAPALAVAYLLVPIDLVPDFVPVLGHLDDALIIGWAIRHLVAAAGRDRLHDHWKGDPATLDRILRLARVPTGRR